MDYDVAMEVVMVLGSPVAVSLFRLTVEAPGNFGKQLFEHQNGFAANSPLFRQILAVASIIHRIALLEIKRLNEKKPALLGHADVSH